MTIQDSKFKIQNDKPEKNSMFFSGFLIGIMGVMPLEDNPYSP